MHPKKCNSLTHKTHKNEACGYYFCIFYIRETGFLLLLIGKILVL